MMTFEREADGRMKRWPALGAAALDGPESQQSVRAEGKGTQ